MTHAERLKLAKAARELASDVAEGRGPTMSPGVWELCVAGHTANGDCLTAMQLDRMVGGALTEATDTQVYDQVDGAVVFPLLWLADELESEP